jgi:hypothetical protein
MASAELTRRFLRVATEEVLGKTAHPEKCGLEFRASPGATRRESITQ